MAEASVSDRHRRTAIPAIPINHRYGAGTNGNRIGGDSEMRFCSPQAIDGAIGVTRKYARARGAARQNPFSFVAIGLIRVRIARFLRDRKHLIRKDF